MKRVSTILKHRWADCKAILGSVCALAMLALPVLAYAHGAERGLIMLLPTGYYLTGGAIAVAASFAVLVLVPPALFSRAAGATARYRDLPAPSPIVTSLVSSAFLALLLIIGFFGTHDPLENPLPLVIWTFFWVIFTLIQAVFGNLWPWLNPWTGPLAALRRLGGRGLGTKPLVPFPKWLGTAPALLLFMLFAWYELVSLSPEDPPSLAVIVLGYWLFTLAMMIVFGEQAWAARGEPFSIYFRLIGRLAPLSFSPGNRAWRADVELSWPGARAVRSAPPSLTAALFLLATLGTASFDGFSETFTWLVAIGINPLEFPGRSAVMGANTLGLIAAPVTLAVLFFSAVLAGAWLAGERKSEGLFRLARHLVYSIVPIAVAFHAAHYLTLMLINGQYLLVVLSDPLGRGWDLFGTADWHVTASFLNNIDSVETIWIAQTLIIVVGHCIGILLAHMIALRHFSSPHRAALSQVFLALVMVFYTVFGLWLLSTPSAS